MAKSNKQGVVNIHGKGYKTVALRVNEFRTMEEYKGYGLLTDLVSADSSTVIMKAWITDTEGAVKAVGFAEENRNSSRINKTSALENCETSAIGRALAALGLAGEEYASADEVANAIHQQGQNQSNNDDKPWFSEDDFEAQIGAIQEAVRSGQHTPQSAVNFLRETYKVSRDMAESIKNRAAE